MYEVGASGCYNVGSRNQRSVLSFADAYHTQKMKLFEDIAGRNQNDPFRETTLNQNLQARDYGARRIGRPKRRWVTQVANQYWDRIKSSLAPDFQHAGLNLNDQQHVSAIEQKAIARTVRRS